jgi:hypothetical protein
VRRRGGTKKRVCRACNNIRVARYFERHPEKKKPKPKPQEFSDLWDRIYKFEETGCWLWQASLSQGYGQVTLGGKNRLVHRLFYEHFEGPIPEGMELHHRCDNTNCVNPEHLQAVSSKEHHAFHYPSVFATRNAQIAAWARERRHRDPQKARALARAKYARRIARDPGGYRAKRRAIEARYRRRKNDLLWGFKKSQSDRIAFLSAPSVIESPGGNSSFQSHDNGSLKSLTK